ncbi:MAG: hypothetical protein RR998_08085 [Oscillospiraceae bacterium]
MLQAIGQFAVMHTFWFVVLCVVVLAMLGLLALTSLWIYGLGRPVSKEEKYRRLPGDEMFGDSGDPFDRIQVAISIDAKKEDVWPWIAQLGQRRAGFYSFGWLERLCGFHIFNTFRVVDEWAHKEAGEFMFYHQCGIGSEVKAVVENEYFTSVSDSRAPSEVPGAIGFKPPFKLDYFGWTWNFYLWDEGESKTRFLSRCDATYEPYDWIHRGIVALILGTASFVMIRRMLDIIKNCAEGRKKPYSAAERLLRRCK